MQHLFSIALFFVAAQFATQTYAQGATSPAAVGPMNITAILEKAGQFNTFIRLMRSTQEESQINNQLNNSNSGLTVFAPTDNAFSSLPSGSLNALTDQEKVSLVQFHILPSAYSISQLQTVSNPVRTQAGDATDGRYPLNVTSDGNQVNISTGVVTVTVDNTIYLSDKLVVYQVRTVLRPEAIFGSPAPAAAPAAAQPAEDKPTAAAQGPSTASTDATTTSAAPNVDWPRIIIAFATAAASLWLSF